MADQLLVVGAFQQRVRHAQDDDLGLADAGMHQRVDIADVAVDHVQAAVGQRPEHVRIEIDHGDLFEQRAVLPLDLAQQRAGRAEEAEDDDPPRLAVPVLVAGLGGMDVIEIANADPLQRSRSRARVIWSLRIITNVLSTARTTKANDAALAVSVWI